MSIRRVIISTVAVLALLATPALADDHSAALAQERYYSSYGSDPGTAAALAQERYYSSFGAPEPLRVRTAPAPADGDLLPLVLISVTGLAFAAAGFVLVRRSRGRRTAGALS